MCGFVGGVTFGGAIEPHVARLQQGLQAIAHRGPDATDAVVSTQVYLGHNRLSIIDLSNAANQPLRAPQADAWIVYNGEIYNFAELRQSLKSVVPFATASDTEVLLQGTSSKDCRSSESSGEFMRLRFWIVDRSRN